MASDWSWNVFRYGLAWLKDTNLISKCSRMHGTTPDGLILTNVLNGIGQAAAVWLPGTVFPDNFLVIYFFRSSPHFPYGYAVDPDLHT